MRNSSTRHPILAYIALYAVYASLTREIFVGLGLAAIALILSGCNPTPARNSVDAIESANAFEAPAKRLSDQEIAEIEPIASSFCGNCHAFPNPSNFTQEDWPREVQRGYDFYFSSGRSDLRVPASAKIKAYYQSLAPEKFSAVLPTSLDTLARERFKWTGLQVQNKTSSYFAGAGAVWFDLGIAGKGVLISDMRGGNIYWMNTDSKSDTNQTDYRLSAVATLRNPGRIVPSDLDSDNVLELLVTDLGSYLPADHQNGRVVLLRPQAQETPAFDITEILTNCGRVADVDSADFDGDGDIDLVVADFGWHQTGSVLWLERIAPELVASSFKPHVVDSRPGALQVPIADLDKDGDMDFVAILAQEFEVIVAYINDGQGNFTSRKLFDLDDPASGSSGMDLIDFDQDGDLDIVHTNGDSFDSFQVKPYHGIRWLENQGNLNFSVREIATMPGVHRAAPNDLDSDGDIDLVAVAFLPPQMKGVFEDRPPEAISWFENDGKQNFTRRPLKTGQAVHASVLVHDINGDGQSDIIAPCFYDVGSNSSIDVEIAESR